MKKQTAAHIRAAQAVVDREEAIEAERNRRRAERARRDQLAAAEQRAAFIESVRVSSRPIILAAKDIAKNSLGVFLAFELLFLVAAILSAFVVPSIAGFPFDLLKGIQVFVQILPTYLLIFPKMIVPFTAYLANGFWRFVPWFGVLILVLLLLKFAVFPVVRFIIQKIRH